MPQTTEGRFSRRRAPLFDGTHGRTRNIGDEALHFARWFLKSKYQLMASFLGELETPPEARDEPAIRARFCRSVTHANNVNRLSGLVTVLLGLGAITTATSAIANAFSVGNALRTLSAWAGSATLVLLGLRFAFDRYLALVDVSATFLAMQLASIRGAGAAPSSAER